MTVTVGFVLAVLVWGFVLGGLARWAVPGPDPMPVWMTTAFGIAGSLLGAAVGLAVFGRTGGFALGLLATVLLVIAYRRLVQRRPLTGPDAQLPPR